MSSSKLLEAKDIAKTVEAPGGLLTILHPLSLSIRLGESLAIVGPSGSGKTTLLGLLAGLDVPSNGRVVLDGQDLTLLSEDQRAALRNRRVGFVFQSFHLLPALTALENAMLPLELANQPQPRQRASEILDRVGLADRLEHYPNQLSGGEKQRVAIARAFVTGPALLFADEPTGNLDTATGEQISDLLFDLNQQQQTTLVLVTHDQGLAKRCDRIASLQQGHLLDDTPKAEPSNAE
nr:lipoprotein-releasing system ATP-binding protein LolD-like [Nerophis lumbriciformis]